jgi:hypothetical protein
MINTVVYSPRLNVNQQLSAIMILAKLKEGIKLESDFDIVSKDGTETKKTLALVNTVIDKNNVKQGILSNLL